jgi:hypothetical protein
MSYTGQIFGGAKRFYYSALAETAFNSTRARSHVLNPIDGSETVGPPNFELLNNANSAQGQGPWATRLFKGAQDLQGSPTFHLTPEAFGKFFASAFGVDTKSTVDTTATQHALTLSASELPSSFTIEEHLDGASDTTTSWYMSGAYAHSIGISVNPGNQYATISPMIVASQYRGVGSDYSATIDADTTYWPNVPGIAPTKCFLWIHKTSNSQHDSVFDGAFGGELGGFTTPGTCESDLSSSIALAQFARNWTLTYNTNCDLTEAYRAGTSGGSGFYRGRPYSLTPSCTLSVTFDVTAATTAEILTYFQNFTDAAPISYTMQFSFASDDKVGSTYYSGGSLVCNAMRLTGVVKTDGGLGPATATATFEGMQAGDGGETAYVEAISWDDVDVDYA